MVIFVSEMFTKEKGAFFLRHNGIYNHQGLFQLFCIIFVNASLLVISIEDSLRCHCKLLHIFSCNLRPWFFGSIPPFSDFLNTNLGPSPYTSLLITPLNFPYHLNRFYIILSLITLMLRIMYSFPSLSFPVLPHSKSFLSLLH